MSLNNSEDFILYWKYYCSFDKICIQLVIGNKYLIQNFFFFYFRQTINCDLNQWLKKSFHLNLDLNQITFYHQLKYPSWECVRLNISRFLCDWTVYCMDAIIVKFGISFQNILTYNYLATFTECVQGKMDETVSTDF